MAYDKAEPPAAYSTIIQPSNWLIILTLSLLAGQAIAALPFQVPFLFALLPLVPLPFLFSPSRRWTALLVSTALLLSVIGYARHRNLLAPSFPPNHLRSVMKEDARLYLEGTLIQEPEKLPNRSRWILRFDRLWHPTGAEDITGDLLLTIRSVHREWRFGDRVRCRLQPRVPRDAGNPGGFNYATYLSRRNIHAVGFLDSDGEVELVARRPGGIGAAVEFLRRGMRRYIDQNFSHDNGALLKALVVGDMGGISKELRESFTAAGVNHVLSISGLHVSMLGLVVFWLIRFGCSFNSYLLLRFNWIKLGTFWSFFAVIFYTAIAGAQVPTVRSAIMIGVYELAVLLDREEEVFASLTFAALLIGLVWPGVIADISFQLSFLAVLFIVWGMRMVQERFSTKQPRDELPQEKSWVREKLGQAGFHLAVPLLATLGTGPLIAHYFGHLSLAGFVSNPLIVPLVGFVVVPLGLMIGFLSLALPTAAGALVWFAEMVLSLTIGLVRMFAQLPLANIGVPAPNPLEVALLYLFILSIMLSSRHRYSFIAVVALAATLLGDGVYWWRERWNRQELRVTHLNVGQGDAAVVELPGSKVLLVDAGGTAIGDFDTGEGIVAPFLRSRKILKVDYLLVSHPRIDHYGGMRTIVNEFAPSEFWSGGTKGQTARFEDLEDALERAKIKQITLNGEQPCRVIDGATLCVLYPSAEKTADLSVVLRLEFGKIRLLFAGDIDKRDEKILQQKNDDLRSAILKVPRHGSATSSTQEFVASVQPKLAVFTAGARNAGGLPREQVVARYQEVGAEILRTDQDGAIVIETDGQKIRYETYKSGKRGTLSF
jgi:competence protein ComEC